MGLITTADDVSVPALAPRRLRDRRAATCACIRWPPA